MEVTTVVWERSNRETKRKEVLLRSHWLFRSCSGIKIPRPWWSLKQGRCQAGKSGNPKWAPIILLSLYVLRRLPAEISTDIHMPSVEVAKASVVTLNYWRMMKVRLSHHWTKHYSAQPVPTVHRKSESKQLLPMLPISKWAIFHSHSGELEARSLSLTVSVFHRQEKGPTFTHKKI